MSRRPHAADRGLAAVGRVRALRENDSRVGLQMVLVGGVAYPSPVCGGCIFQSEARPDSTTAADHSAKLETRVERHGAKIVEDWTR